MRRVTYTAIAVLALTFGAVSPALGQDTGIDEYIEDVPSVEGGDTTESGSGTSSSATGTDSATGVVAGSEGTTGTAATQAGTTTTGAGAELPRTGSETAVLAAIGLAMLLAGLVIRRRAIAGSRPSEGG